MKQDMILVLDLGSEENPRLAREIRALGVYSEIHPHDITLEELKALPNVKGIILNGGPNRVVDGVEIDVSKDIYNYDVPVLLADHKGDKPWPADPAERKEALSNFVFGLCGGFPYLRSKDTKKLRHPPMKRQKKGAAGCPAGRIC